MKTNRILLVIILVLVSCGNTFLVCKKGKIRLVAGDFKLYNEEKAKRRKGPTITEEEIKKVRKKIKRKEGLRIPEKKIVKAKRRKGLRIPKKEIVKARKKIKRKEVSIKESVMTWKFVDIDRSIAENQSGLLKDMLDDEDDEGVPTIPLQNVRPKDLEQIVNLMIQADKLKSKEKLATLIEKQGWDKKKRMYLLKAADYLNAQLMMRSLAWNLSGEKIVKEDLEKFPANIFFEIIVQYILKKQTNNSSKIMEIFDEDVLKDLTDKKIIDKITAKMFDKEKPTKEEVEARKELLGKQAMFIPVYKDKKFVRLSRPFVISKAIKNFTTYNLLASGSYDGIILWDISDPNNPKKIKTFKKQDDMVGLVAFNPDGKLFASGSYDGIILWNISDSNNPKKIKTFKTSEGFSRSKSFPHSVVFSPNGKWLASGSTEKIKLWKLSDPNNPKTFEASKSLSRSVVFNPDGKLFASGSYDGIILWDISDSNNPKKIKTFKTSEGFSRSKSFPHSVVFSPNGKWLASGFFQTIILWDVSDPNNPKKIKMLDEHKEHVRSVAFSPDGKWLASRSYDRIILWDISDPNNPKKIKTLEGDFLIYSVAFSPAMLLDK